MTDENDTPNNAGVIAPPPLIYGGALGAGLLAKALFPSTFLPRGAARAPGVPLTGAGLLLFISSLRALRRAETDMRPYKPTTSIVAEGP